ncbi:MAG: bifunctional 2-polyprenyl-6-hydroxyphenol methylase/3-demethylubiquinol 3-O-methyltransferase UbiG [Gammaproteobacteria bacterium]|nr:bifunctional 2-polyprenyl-6-hydroxyphenol methylase/3-demethylubiquinol 3-O-methyltransferase UbiG [Gammaproteobacteria bacterium]
MSNIDVQEIAKFSNLANDWWDENGPLRTLHDMNSARLRYILNHTPLRSLRVLDVGCGGGLLSEAMAKQGATVCGIDLDQKIISVARDHAAQSGLHIDYQCIDLESLVAQQPQPFDIITCLELLEHVPDGAQMIQHCAKLLKPKGFLYLSTLNRTLKSYGLAIVAAEYLLGLLPRGTHDFNKFIKPSELSAWCREANLSLYHLQGLEYQPFKRQTHFCEDLSVNYIALFQH